MVPGRDGAELLALRALEWLSADPEIFASFLGTTGAEPGDLRGLAGEPAFLVAVLDFLLAEDRRTERFSADAGYPPEMPLAARAVLGGGDMTHWT